MLNLSRKITLKELVFNLYSCLGPNWLVISLDNGKMTSVPSLRKGDNKELQLHNLFVFQTVHLLRTEQDQLMSIVPFNKWLKNTAASEGIISDIAHAAASDSAGYTIAIVLWSSEI